MVALPLLESFRSRAAAGGDPRRRFAVFMRSGNGVQQQAGSEPERFWPMATGALTAATLPDARATGVLRGFADRVSIIGGLRRPFGTPACGHAESIPQCLTAADTTGGTAMEPQARGKSADWRIAEQLSPGEDPLTLVAGPVTSYIGAALSWRNANDRAPAESSPANAFSRLMGLPDLPSALQERINNRKNSINDYVREEMTALMSSPQLSGRDRRRLDQHFQAIRDFETGGLCVPVDELGAEAMAITNPESNDVRPAVVELHNRLIAFAFSCGQTRAATLQIGEGNDGTQYEVGGVRLPRFHWISHRLEGDGSEGEPIPNADLLHHEIDKIQLGFYGHLLESLDQYESADGGSLLDDCAAVWMNDLSAGVSHGGDNVPWIIGGGAGGNLRMGQYIDLPGDPTYEKILNTILTAVGCTDASGGPVEDFGDPSLPGGRIDELVM